MRRSWSAAIVTAALMVVGSAGYPVAAAPTTTGNLAVETAPAGARITIDGTALGKTPHTVRKLQPGAHQVLLSRTGYRPWQGSVTVTAGKTAHLFEKLLKAKAIPSGEKKRRAHLSARGGAFAKDLAELSLLSISIPSGGLKAPRAPQTFQDPTTGLWVSLDANFDDNGDLVVTADFFLDQAATQPAGQLTATVADTTTVDYDFTAGPYSGVTGHLVVTLAADLSGATVDGSGTLQDGSTYTEQLTITFTDTGFAIDGTADVTAPDGTTSHWEITARGDGQDITVTTSDGDTLTLHLNADGSGTGTATDSTGAVLATFAWTADGVLTVTYPDGTTQTYQLFQLASSS